jgi:hypothetical protein
MRIVYLGDTQGLWEHSWIRYLTGCFFDRIEKIEKEPLASSDTVFISSPNLLGGHLARLLSAGKRFGVILTSDEALQDDNNYAKNSLCQFVIRNYVHPASIQQSNCLCIGLGYKNNFEKFTMRCDFFERKYAWNFIGSVHHADRQNALNSFARLSHGFVHQTSGFDAKDYLSTEEYAKILSQSVFTLCPMGHVNIDTFRVYESLEAGSIPVVLKNGPLLNAIPSYWHFIFPGELELPFLVCDDWVEAALQVDAEVKSGLARIRAAKCVLFWEKWKQTWRYAVQAKLLDFSILHQQTAP